jgi:DNA-binding MarR family transcriptional regulator
MAQSTELGEKEFALIQQIAKNPSVTQRGLSESTGLSLGTTNLLVRRLARKGLIKINQLDWKRASYLLTLKGAAEKSQKAYRYTLYTWRIFRQIAGNIGAVLRREYDAGRRRFWLVAEDEILELLKEEIQNLGLVGTNVSFYKSLAGLPKEADIVLTATLELPPSSENGRRFIRLVDFDNIDFKA